MKGDEPRRCAVDAVGQGPARHIVLEPVDDHVHHSETLFVHGRLNALYPGVDRRLLTSCVSIVAGSTEASSQVTNPGDMSAAFTSGDIPTSGSVAHVEVECWWSWPRGWTGNLCSLSTNFCLFPQVLLVEVERGDEDVVIHVGQVL